MSITESLLTFPQKQVAFKHLLIVSFDITKIGFKQSANWDDNM